MQSTLPAGVHPVIAMDQSTSVKDSLEAVNKSLIEGVCLVVIIVFLFLHTAKSDFYCRSCNSYMLDGDIYTYGCIWVYTEPDGAIGIVASL